MYLVTLFVIIHKIIIYKIIDNILNIYEYIK